MLCSAVQFSHFSFYTYARLLLLAVMLHRVASITHSSISATTLSFISSFQISQTIPVTLLNKILYALLLHKILEPPRKSA